MSQKIKIREATLDDAPRISEIYAPYAKNTAITFEWGVPDAEEFRKRIKNTLELHPYIVAEDETGYVIGYAYASKLSWRKAYNWSVELSVYVDEAHRRNGTGSALYHELERLLLKQNVVNTYVCVTYCDKENEYCNNDSIRFHEKEGFTTMAHFHQCGYKFSQWWDDVWMEKHIAPHPAEQKEFIPYKLLKKTDK